jgi:hypothetical protein
MEDHEIVNRAVGKILTLGCVAAGAIMARDLLFDGSSDLTSPVSKVAIGGVALTTLYVGARGVTQGLIGRSESDMENRIAANARRLDAERQIRREIASKRTGNF